MNLARNIRRFILQRHHDQSGVSGVGQVAEGCMFSDGRCAVRFISPTGSTNTYDSIEAVKAVHGHGGATEIMFLDEDPHPITQPDVAPVEAVAKEPAKEPGKRTRKQKVQKED
jgi:hypothetical protein